MGRIMLIHYKDFVSKWNEIVEIFSPEAVRKGSFAKYAEGIKMIGLTPESMAEQYPVVLRVQPVRVRTME